MANKVAGKGSGGRPATGSVVWEDPETKTKPIGVRVTKANRLAELRRTQGTISKRIEDPIGRGYRSLGERLERETFRGSNLLDLVALVDEFVADALRSARSVSSSG